MSVSGQKVNNGVRYASFGCTAHASRGGSIRTNNTTINEKKLTEAFLDHMTHEGLPLPNVLKLLGADFEGRASAKITAGRANSSVRSKLPRSASRVPRG